MTGASRRALLGVSAATLAAPAPAVAAGVVPAGLNDRRLVELHSSALQARAAEEVAYSRGGGFELSDDPQERAAWDEYEDAAEAADERWDSALREMARIEADGALGLSVKLSHVLRGLDVGLAAAEEDVAESLEADIRRMFPALPFPAFGKESGA
ncbi:hypothetical protein GXW71_28275 [Roseomonas hellenica]|uniref:Uncharacterized protein n=1 Tax=Plastoroseomonas hellenica TaxID=2687306 RepID=A0ABS5F6V1_9PROT|nr:hypothetical protein [Plastoroseomonas hellenica]MBR0668282.1 hypothetical protein [Plastoroseomonas hellenica]